MHFSMSSFLSHINESFETSFSFEKFEIKIYFKTFSKSFESFTFVKSELILNYLDISHEVLIEGGVFERHFEV